MQVPENIKTYDFTDSTIWIDEFGILYSVPKPGIPKERPISEIDKDLKRINEITGGKKVVMVLESNSNSKPPSKELREYIAKEFSKIVKAMAVITTSPLSKMLANLFFGLKPADYPVKMFTDENEAKEWAKKNL
jgi:hypothetical protein